MIQTEKKFDQELNFLFGVNKSFIEESLDKRTKCIQANLKLKNDVIVKLWLEDSFKCQDFLGQFTFYLIDIFEKGVKDIREFKRDDQVIPYYTRVLKDRSQFESSYTKQENFILDYEVWFYPSSFTNAVELTREDIAKKSDKGNPINEQVDKIMK